MSRRCHPHAGRHEMRLPLTTVQCGSSCNHDALHAFVTLEMQFCELNPLSENLNIFSLEKTILSDRNEWFRFLPEPDLSSASEQACVHDVGEGEAPLEMDGLALERLAALVCVEAPFCQLAPHCASRAVVFHSHVGPRLLWILFRVLLDVVPSATAAACGCRIRPSSDAAQATQGCCTTNRGFGPAVTSWHHHSAAHELHVNRKPASTTTHRGQ